MKLIIEAILQPHDTCDDAVMIKFPRGKNQRVEPFGRYHYVLSLHPIVYICGVFFNEATTFC